MDLLITMKLILSLTLLWALSSTAEALQCETCTDFRCSTTTPQTCTTQTMCITSSQRATSGLFSQQLVSKSCDGTSLCAAVGSETYSVSVNDSRTAASVKCCNTDNCNTETLDFPSDQTNSLQCFTCDHTTTECTKLQCKGAEDRCFRANVTVGSITGPVSGCTSASVCAASQNQIFQSVVGNFSADLSCCATSLCNGAAPKTSAGTFIGLAVIQLLTGLFIFSHR